MPYHRSPSRERVARSVVNDAERRRLEMPLMIGDLKQVTPARRATRTLPDRFAAEPMATHVLNWLSGKVFGNGWAS